MSNVNPRPPEYPGATPYLIVNGGDEAIRFYQRAFGATEVYRLGMPDGRIGHAELELAGGRIMLADEGPDWRASSPKTLGGSPVTLMIYVEDADAVFRRAVAAGATAMQEPEDHFYGDRSGRLADPFGHEWIVSTHVEDVSPEEMERRMAALPPMPADQ